MIDWNFIFIAEGRELKGYVPMKDGKPIQQSGVTVATGCDIGQLTSQQLRDLCLPPNLFSKLNPYTALRREEAVKKLRALPLTISDEEAKILDEAIHGAIIKRFVRNYNLASKIKFEHLPDAAQTVLASLAVNWGPNFYRKHPQSWDLAVRQQWPLLAARLSSVSPADPLDKRREKEAKLLRTIK